jgi:hypothetical protein
LFKSGFIYPYYYGNFLVFGVFGINSLNLYPPDAIMFYTPSSKPCQPKIPADITKGRNLWGREMLVQILLVLGSPGNNKSESCVNVYAEGGGKEE